MSKNSHKCKKCADAKVQEMHGAICVDLKGFEPLPYYNLELLPKDDEWKRAYMTLVKYLRREYQRDHKNRFKGDIDANGRANAYMRAYCYAQGVASNHGVELPDLDY